jgi:hypothetical protein
MSRHLVSRFFVSSRLLQILTQLSIAQLAQPRLGVNCGISALPGPFKTGQDESVLVHPKQVRLVKHMDGFMSAEPTHMLCQLQNTVKVVLPRVDNR